MECAEDVYLHDRTKPVRRDPEGRRREVAGRSRDQHIERPERLVSGAQRLGDRLRIADVGGKAGRLAAVALELGDRRRYFFLGAAEDADGRTGLRERLGDAEIDAAGAAGDEYVGHRKIERITHGPALSKRSRWDVAPTVRAGASPQRNDLIGGESNRR